MTDAEFLQKLEAARPLVQKICRAYGPTADARADLFQEIALQAWRSRASFRGEAKFSTWLYRIGLNVALMARRKKLPETVELEKAPPISVAPTTAEPSDLERLWAAIGRLDDAEKSLVLLYLDDLSYAEMAEVTGLTANHVGVKLNRVRARLREFLKE